MTDDEIMAGLAKAIENGREAWAGVNATEWVEQQRGNTAEPADEPHRMLPLCSVCGQRVSLSGALHDGKAWQCLSHTRTEQPTCQICQGPMSRGLYEAADWTPGALRWDNEA